MNDAKNQHPVPVDSTQEQYREQQIIRWIEDDLGYKNYSLKPASADASFRRYFRLEDNVNGDTKIIMDAPPEKEDSRPFIHLAQAFNDIGLNTPKVYAQNFEAGFFLLSDLGSIDYLRDINNQNVNQLYQDAMHALIILQHKNKAVLPTYNAELLRQEMNLFIDWFLTKHKQVNISKMQQKIFDDLFALLVDSALAQPNVCVHRDYHSRNLMVTADNNPGVLDFQDAVMGPVTYDLVSLLRDCYVTWPDDKVACWTEYYFNQASQQGILKNIDYPQFVRWFDLMGLQRHLKAIGIFSRLNYRDGKSGYLNDIPRTLSYVLMVSKKYPELNAFHQVICDTCD